MVCTFFGHRTIDEDIRPRLYQTLSQLIERHRHCLFLVGHQGAFDRTVMRVLVDLKGEYPQIEYAVVLSSPNIQSRAVADLVCSVNPKEALESAFLLPDGFENVPPRFAMDRRNRWMLDRADTVVVYVRHMGGGAAKFKQAAEKKGKTVINLAVTGD